MAIYKVNPNLPRADQIEAINDMIVELDGKITNGKFDQREIEVLQELPRNKKYVRDIYLGNTDITYTSWTHYKALTGYSIWKYHRSEDGLYNALNYEANDNNEIYFDNKLLNYRGIASAVGALAFDKVFLYNGDSGSEYIDITADVISGSGETTTILDSTNDYLYIGKTETFAGIAFDFNVRGSGYNLLVEQWTGAAWEQVFYIIENSGGTLHQGHEDFTNNFESNGYIKFYGSGGWTITSVDSSDQLYYIRISTTTTPIVTGVLNYISPYNSVETLLSMSSEQIQNEEWCWCDFFHPSNGWEIYVSIRNSGNSAYEGDYYITASSSDANKQNFFVDNHIYKRNSERLSYAPYSLWYAAYSDLFYIEDNKNESFFYIQASLETSSFDVNLPLASTIINREFIFKIDDIPSGVVVRLMPHPDDVAADSGWFDYTNQYYTFTTDYETVHILCDGYDYHIMSNSAGSGGGVSLAQVKADPDIASAISLKHTQNTDTTLTTNGTEVLIQAGTLKKNLTVENHVTIDGRDVSVDGAKLDTIQQGAQVNGASFGKIALETSGGTNVIAEIPNDTFTLVEGANVTITGDNTAKTITIASTASGSGDTFKTISVEESGQADIVASGTDTLKIEGGSNVTITSNASTKTITITAGFSGTFTNANLTAGVLTIRHNLGLTSPHAILIAIFDNTNKQIIPDDITGATNTVAIDLSSYGTLSGVWGYRYI